MFLMEHPKQKMDVLDPHLEAPQAVRARILRFFQGRFTGNIWISDVFLIT